MLIYLSQIEKGMWGRDGAGRIQTMVRIFGLGFTL